jgi:hypothetical protein
MKTQSNRIKPGGGFCRRTRREFLHNIGGGFTSLALTGMLAKDGFLSQQTLASDGETTWKSPMKPKAPHFLPKAKNVIFLFMYGGPSHVDTFDYKPELYPFDGKTIDVKTFGRGGHKNQGAWSGQSGDSSSMAKVVNMYLIYFLMWLNMSMTLLSFTR